MPILLGLSIELPTCSRSGTAPDRQHQMLLRTAEYNKIGCLPWHGMWAGEKTNVSPTKCGCWVSCVHEAASAPCMDWTLAECSAVK